MTRCPAGMSRLVRLVLLFGLEAVQSVDVHRGAHQAKWSAVATAESARTAAGAAGRNATAAGRRKVELGCGFSLFTCQAGDGKNFPRKGNDVRVHYTGRLVEGDAEFDSSRERGRPFAFTIGVGEVIAGWDEGVMRMSLGERALLRVPAAKAYGERGSSSGSIPPNADLYFDVELLTINGKEAGTPPAPEQGFEGEEKSHKNMETCVEDWRREYGPKAGEKGSCSDEGDRKDKGSDARSSEGQGGERGAAQQGERSGAAGRFIRVSVAFTAPLMLSRFRD